MYIGNYKNLFLLGTFGFVWKRVGFFLRVGLSEWFSITTFLKEIKAFFYITLGFGKLAR